MTKIIAAAALGLLALTACGEEAPKQQAPQIRAANPISDQLKTMDELYRYLGLRRAIVDSGQRCKKVIWGAYQEEYKTMAMWAARCSDSGDWAIYIAPNADAQVRRCGNLPRLGLPPCKVDGAPASGG